MTEAPDETAILFRAITSSMRCSRDEGRSIVVDVPRDRDDVIADPFEWSRMDGLVVRETVAEPADIIEATVQLLPAHLPQPGEGVHKPRLPQRRLVAPRRISWDPGIREPDPEPEARGGDDLIRLWVAHATADECPGGVGHRPTLSLQEPYRWVVPPVVPSGSSELVVDRIPDEHFEAADRPPER